MTTSITVLLVGTVCLACSLFSSQHSAEAWSTGSSGPFSRIGSTRIRSVQQEEVVGHKLDETPRNRLPEAPPPRRCTGKDATNSARPAVHPPAAQPFWKSFLLGLTVSVAAVMSSPAVVPILPALASDYGALTDEQKLVAEAWRLVDNSFLDRTFNGQDWFRLREQYVHQRYKSLPEAQSALNDMIGTLGDKYTRYLPPAKYQSIVDAATGTLAGVGIEISVNADGRVMASDVEDQSPAQAGGIRPGDVFLEVDGTKFDDGRSTPDDVALKLRGPKGSKVGVVMERNGKVLDYILTRQPITITAVKGYSSSVSGIGKVGVIRIKSFSATTAATVSEKLQDLKKQGCKAFVLDCRGNPGGLLPGGVDTAALFLDADKPVVFVVNKNGVVDAQATLGPGIDLDSPIVLLVDSGTASAAEVFTAALKENGRAVVAGSQTFGKGIVQTIRSLSDNRGGVAITVARYETPQHHDINKQGIPVDVPTPVDCPKDDATACLKASVFQQAASSST